MTSTIAILSTMMSGTSDRFGARPCTAGGATGIDGGVGMAIGGRAGFNISVNVDAGVAGADCAKRARSAPGATGGGKTGGATLGTDGIADGIRNCGGGAKPPDGADGTTGADGSGTPWTPWTPCGPPPGVHRGSGDANWGAGGTAA